MALATRRSSVSSRASSGKDCWATSRNHAIVPCTCHSAIGRGLPCSVASSAMNFGARVE